MTDEILVAKLNRRKMKRYENNKKTEPSRSMLNSWTNGNVYLCTVMRLKEGVERMGGARSEGQAGRERRTGSALKRKSSKEEKIFP